MYLTYLLLTSLRRELECFRFSWFSLRVGEQSLLRCSSLRCLCSEWIIWYITLSVTEKLFIVFNAFVIEGTIVWVTTSLCDSNVLLNCRRSLSAIWSYRRVTFNCIKWTMSAYKLIINEKVTFLFTLKDFIRSAGISFLSVYISFSLELELSEELSEELSSRLLIRVRALPLLLWTRLFLLFPNFLGFGFVKISSLSVAKISSPSVPFSFFMIFSSSELISIGFKEEPEVWVREDSGISFSCEVTIFCSTNLLTHCARIFTCSVKAIVV